MADRKTHVANFFETELTTELGPTDLVADVLSTGGLQSPALLVIEPDNPNQREVILFDGAFTDTQFRATSIANRYLGGSAQPGGLTHPVGSVVRSAPLAQHIQDLNDRVDADRLRITSLEEATVGTAKLEDGAVTTPKLADGAVTGPKIADEAVTTDKIATHTVTTTKIADLAVTPAKIAEGAVTAAKIADQAVTGPKIADQAITNRTIADGNVTVGKIGDGAVTAGKIAGNAISAFERSGATVAADVNVPSSVGNLATVTLSIPTSWSTWNCVAFAQATALPLDNPSTIGLIVRIDGTDGAQFDYQVLGPGRDAVAAASFRSGITTTGNRTIALRGLRTSAGSVRLSTVFLYARAFRTS